MQFLTYHHIRLLPSAWIFVAFASLFIPCMAVANERPRIPALPTYAPARQPIIKDEFVVGVITITFRDTELQAPIEQIEKSIKHVSTPGPMMDVGMAAPMPRHDAREISQQEYFKIYSNGITWPNIVILGDEKPFYEDHNFFGYYCRYHEVENPVGWQTEEEGLRRVEELNRRARNTAMHTYRRPPPKFFCFNYMIHRKNDRRDDLTQTLLSYYQYPGLDPNLRIRSQDRPRPRAVPAGFDPWNFYAPQVKWGDPMWPSTAIQILNASGDTLAYMIGRNLGAPNVHRLGPQRDGIGGVASLMNYGPSANAFSRFYHHGFISERNHPVIKRPGTYTLHPRHITPQDGQSVGFLVPSRHPYYHYHLEYVYGEDPVVGVGSGHEGMLISVVNLGRTNDLGSPDYFYTYRPQDPFFRGQGDLQQPWFGVRHGRTSFNMETEPSSRLPNLLDGGVLIRNIEEKQGTLTFELGLAGQQLSRDALERSMLPQVQLDSITNRQMTSFAMQCTIMFRGEPLKTSYGFCWSTRPGPTIGDSNFILSHREIYRGHANKLQPDTTYYVRAFVTNGVGVNYSNEAEVRTMSMEDKLTAIAPLCIDEFSNNEYLYRRYSNEGARQPGQWNEAFVGYSPTCVLAKLVAYHRPKRFPAVDEEGKQTGIVDFDKLNWNPGFDHHPSRVEETHGFMRRVYQQGVVLGFHSPQPPHANFLQNFVRLIGAETQPVLTAVTDRNLMAVYNSIIRDLALSRPVVVMFHHRPGPRGGGGGEASRHPRWALIHGCDEVGKLYIDFPRNTRMLTENGEQDVISGMYPKEFLLHRHYFAHVITSIDNLR